MTPSPGQQTNTPPASLRGILLALLFCALPATYLFLNKERIREYWLYLTEDREAVTLAYTELSADWTEKRLRERFGHLPLRCTSSSPRNLGDRACSVDVKSHNGIPTVFMSFFFTSGRLSHVSFNVPWWAHAQARRAIESVHGQRVAAQFLPRSGVRLEGWRLPGGAGLFYNSDRSLNPFEWNSIFWNSAESCASGNCFTPR